jgi:hypothetical protein
MTATTNRDEGPEGRRAARSSMYVAAILCRGGESLQVRIRNMSPTGALIEGAFELADDETVHLVRGALSSEAQVVWCSGGRAGVDFAREVEVKRWLAPPTNAEQQRVDALVRLVQAGAVPLPVPELEPPAGAAVEQSVQHAEDLNGVRTMLGTLSDALADHPRIIAEHAGAVQSLDIAMQVLAAIADELRDGGGGEPTAKLCSLRRSMMEALGERG